MELTRESLLHNGTLIKKKSEKFPYDHVFITGCFRIFYSLSGPTSPRNLRDGNHDGIPDYIDNIALRFETARILLTDGFGLNDPLKDGLFHDQGAEYVDVYLQEIPREHGIASDRVYDLRAAILEGTPFQGKSLRIKIHRNLIARTGTPLHEFFHLCQYNYSMFNNMWFMEGLARWSQSIITEGTGQEENLPGTAGEIVHLLKKYHEAEFFWNRLTSLCDRVGTFVLPEVLKDNEGIINTHRPGGKLVQQILENTSKQFRCLLNEQKSRQLDKKEYLSEIEKKSPNNNRYILQAIIDAIETTCETDSLEVERFVKVVREFISSSTSLFQTDSVQSFMTTLRKCHPELCIESDSEYCYSDHFDPPTRTLTVPRLDCSSLTDEDLESFKVLEHVNGDVIIQDNARLTSLDGLSNLETVNGRFDLINSGVKELSGLTRLRLVKGLNIERMSELRSINGFTSLLLVRNALRITGNPRLHSINGFTSLEGSRNGLIVQDNGALEQITGFTALARIDYGSVLISQNPVLVSVTGLTGLTFVRDTLSVSNCPKLSDFRFLSYLENVGNIEVDGTGLIDGSPLRNLFAKSPHFKGSIKFTRNSGLSDLSFMHGLTTVGSSLYLHQNSLVNTRGLEQLRRVGASFNLSANRLTDISQLSSLEEIEGILGLSYNRLSSLHGLENLRRIRSKKWGNALLSIKFNDNRLPDGSISLHDIGALANVKEVTNRLVVFTDSESGHAYRIKPGTDSVFYRRNANFEVYGRTPATELPLSHICNVPLAESGVPILFPDMSTPWQRCLRQCQGIIPYFFPFREVDKVVSYCLDKGIDIVVGIKLSSQKFIARHGQELRRHGLRIIANEPQTLNSCENKRDFRIFMEKQGFEKFIPTYYNTPESIRYPCIIKPFYGSFGSGQRIVHSGQQLGEVSKDEVVCEYIEGPVEYVSHFCFVDRKTFREVTYKKTYNKPFFILGKEDKNNLTYEKVPTPWLDLLVDILDKMQFQGICCFNYKPVKNEPKIFEINARIGFTLAAQPYDFKMLFDLFISHAC